MPTLTSEKTAKAKTFEEFTQEEQIFKLRYELQIALRTIARIGDSLSVLKKHEHSGKGNVLVDINCSDITTFHDRSEFLK